MTSLMPYCVYNFFCCVYNTASFDESSGIVHVFLVGCTCIMASHDWSDELQSSCGDMLYVRQNKFYTLFNKLYTILNKLYTILNKLYTIFFRIDFFFDRTYNMALYDAQWQTDKQKNMHTYNLFDRKYNRHQTSKKTKTTVIDLSETNCIQMSCRAYNVYCNIDCFHNVAAHDESNAVLDFLENKLYTICLIVYTICI